MANDKGTLSAEELATLQAHLNKTANCTHLRREVEVYGFGSISLGSDPRNMPSLGVLHTAIGVVLLTCPVCGEIRFINAVTAGLVPRG